MDDPKVRKMILSKQTDKNNTAVVYIEQLAYDSNLKKSTKRISTNVRVNPKHWSKNKQEVLKSDPDCDNKNRLINDCYDANRKPLENFKKIKGITEYFEEYIALRKAGGSPEGTVKEFTTTKNRILCFEEYSGGKKLQFKDINMTFSDGFNVWLHSVKNYDSGTIEKTYTILRTFMNHYYSRKDEINIEIYDTFREKKWKKGSKSINPPHPMLDKDWIKFSESKSLEETQEISWMKYDGILLNESEVKIRDRFLFQCATGLRFGDAFTVTPSMIDDNTIEIIPAKTKHIKNKYIYININYLSKKILKKYNGGTTELKITNQAYNRGLRDLCVKLELNEKYKSHDARDTFITNAINEGISVPIILSWTGQESYEVMKRYFKVDKKKKAADMTKIKVYTDLHKYDEDPNVSGDLEIVMEE